MRSLAIVAAVLGLAAASAAADPAPAVAPRVAAPAAPAADAKPATCKRVVKGKGLERHVVCEFEPVIVRVEPPKPAVVILHQDPRSVVGRPHSGDRLSGLSHQLR